MKRKELEAEIRTIEEQITHYQNELKEKKKELEIIIKQEEKRKEYISSSEIIELIFRNIGKRINMSTIKRWADEGYLGEITEEKELFWALRHKQGKKRFLYPLENVYQFLYEKGYLHARYEVLDRVCVTSNQAESIIGIIIDSQLEKANFYYTIQKEGSFEQVMMVSEDNIKLME